MNKPQAESLYILTRSPEWAIYLSIQQEKLKLLHEQMEWEKPENIKHVQGRALEIKETFKLAQQADDFLKTS
jgi:hypothetical protein